MISNSRGKILCEHIASGKRNFMDKSFVNNKALMKSKGWSIVEEPKSPPASNLGEPGKPAENQTDKKPAAIAGTDVKIPADAGTGSGETF